MASFFYAYVSASAHTGFEAASTSNLFFFRDLGTGTLSLFMVHGVDFDTTGLRQPLANVDFTISGVPGGVTVAVADDTPMELFAGGGGTFFGSWFFQDNTDGGVLQSLPFPGRWTITIAPTFDAGISRLRWVHGPTGTFGALDRTRNVVLDAYDTPSMCRRNCTVPRCGDRIMDGGEVCDDGNVVGGDGCAADCRSLM
jgi:cysteine-rich repeat protein